MVAARIARARHWVFDLDGTLTVAVHDFDAIRAELGLPVGRPILEALADLPPEEAAPLVARLDAIELEIAREARPADGASDLLSRLRSAGVDLGIATRNSRENALETLRAAGLDGFFPREAILGRDEAPPKPRPDAILRLLASWRGASEAAVMVGDYLFDLEAGREAGAVTVYVDPSGLFPFARLADLQVRSLADVAAVARLDFADPRR
ncbi:MAG: HAD family hydrolase [Alphaproteobacteria bacterium]